MKRQLIADAPVVSMLSGGLDSSGLTSMAARYMAEEGKQLGTYSLDFAGSDKHFKADLLHVSRDEPFVKIVAEYANTDHHTVIINHDQLTEHVFLPVEAHDLPALGEMEASLHLLFSEMKKMQRPRSPENPQMKFSVDIPGSIRMNFCSPERSRGAHKFATSKMS